MKEGGREEEEGNRLLQWNFKRGVEAGGYQHVYIQLEEVKKLCVCVCGTLLVCMHARICTWAGSNYKVLQAFKPTSI